MSKKAAVRRKAVVPSPYGQVAYKRVKDAEVPRRVAPHMAQWLTIIRDAVEHPGESIILEQLGGRTQRQAIAACRGLASRQPRLLNGLRLAMRSGPGETVYIKAVRADERAWETVEER